MRKLPVLADNRNEPGLGLSSAAAMKEGCSSRRFTVITKPTLACNLACNYCYEANQPATKNMSLELLEQLTAQAIEYVGSSRPLHFLWHGGEPLLAGISFYQQALDIQNRLGKKVQITNSLQTNGTLLTEKMAEFFQQHGFTLGFSLDGDSQLHNASKPTKKGDNTFEKVMYGMKLAQQYHIGGKGAIAVLTKASLPYLKDTYYFFERERLNLQINPLIRAGRGKQNNLALTAAEYGQAMINLSNLWLDTALSDSIHVEPLEEIISNFMFNGAKTCTYSGSCRDTFIAVDPTGAIFPCSRFNDATYRLGYVQEEGIKAALSSSLQQSLVLRQSAILPECQSCEFASFCNGGCMHNAIAETGQYMERDPYCEGYQQLFTHLKEKLTGEMEKAKISSVEKQPNDYFTVLDYPISISRIQNSILSRILERNYIQASCIFTNHSESYPDHHEHREHSEKYAERHNEYSVHSERYKEYNEACY